MADGNGDWCLSEWNGEARQTFTKTQHFCLDIFQKSFFVIFRPVLHMPNDTLTERLSITFILEFVWHGLGVLPHNSLLEQGGWAR